MNGELVSSIHLIGIALLLIAMVIRGFSLFKLKEGQTLEASTRKLFVAIQHSALTIVIVTGLILLSLKNFNVETWFYAKVILFLVMLSSLIKAFKKDESILLVQRKAGLVIALVAFISIYGLVLVQPSFG